MFHTDIMAIEVGEEALEKVTKKEGLGRRPARKLERLYRVGEVLGKGGFGTVYAGHRRKDGMAVAIKHIARSKVGEMEMVRNVQHNTLSICFTLPAANDTYVGS
jgi:serine/threonine protein kinase